VTCQLLAGDSGDEADLLCSSPSRSPSAGSGLHLLLQPPSPGSSPLASPLSPFPGLHRAGSGGSDGSSVRVASTRLPSSYRPSKGEVNWDQRLDVATLRLNKLLAPGVGPVRLRLMLWASVTSTLLGQVELPLLVPTPASSGASDEEQEEEEGGARSIVPPLLQVGVQRVPMPFFHHSRLGSAAGGRRTPLDRRGSAVEPSAFQTRKRQLPPRWRRAASEPMRDDARALSVFNLQLDGGEDGGGRDNDDEGEANTYVARPFAWPAQGQLVVDVGLLSLVHEGVDEQKEEADATAVGRVVDSSPNPLVLVHALLARPADLLGKEEACVVWAQRQSLAQDGRALVKLLRAALAYGPFWGEGAVGVGALLEMWAAAGCILTTLDAMKLLGRCVRRIALPSSCTRSRVLPSHISIHTKHECMDAGTFPTPPSAPSPFSSWSGQGTRRSSSTSSSSCSSCATSLGSVAAAAVGGRSYWRRCP
jgi:hypothetical protein